MRLRCGWFGLLALLVLVPQANALITYTLPLQTLINDSTYIGVARVESLDPERPSLTLVHSDDLTAKKVPWKKLPVLMKGDAEAAKLKHVPDLFKRLDKDLPLVLFLADKDKKVFGFAYTNGTWFQIVGTKDGDDVRWALTHAEPNLRRTFKGTTAELQKEVADVIGKKKDKAVAPDEKEKPGFGPEIDKKKEDKKDRKCSRQGGGLFAVIPTVAIGGPLAILALLFPAVFGGVFVLFRRWIVLISVVSINSTLYFVQGWFSEDLQGTVWGSPRWLWLTLTAITLVGVGLTWRRQVKALTTVPDYTETELPGGALDDPEVPPLPELERPGLLEQWFLYAVGGLTLAGFVVLLALGVPLLPDFQLPLVLSCGLWAGAVATAVYVVRLALGGGLAARVPTEGVMLGAMTLASILTLPDSVQPTALASSVQAGQRGAVNAKTVWTFERQAGVNGQFDVASSPAITEDRVYIGMIRKSTFEGVNGVVYCVERGTDKVAWSFDDGGNMAMMFSSPCVADGKVFIGEGFHENRDCKLFCLDAATGAKVWPPFETKSHNESTPAVAAGKVVFGAGDEGVYCLDVNTGKQLWRYPADLNDNTGVHVDASPVIVGKRVYCCSGVSQKYKRLQVFCLDLDTGKVEWTQDSIELPCWGSPAVLGDRVYVGLGNGRLTLSDDKPRGGVLCLSAATGSRQWYFDKVKDAVHCKPAVDANNVYFGSRDGNVYCVERFTGHLRWTKEMFSPVVAAPALAECSHCGATATVYVASMMGQLYALDPNTGQEYWAHTEMTDKQIPQLISSPAVVVNRTAQGDRRQIYFATAVQNPATGAQAAKVFCIEDYWSDGTK